MTRIATGLHCLTLTDTSVNTTIAPTVTPNCDLSAGNGLGAYVSTNTGSCPAGTSSMARTFTWKASVDPASSDYVGFNVLVP